MNFVWIEGEVCRSFFMRKREETIILLLHSLGGKRVLGTFTMKVAPAAGTPDDKSFISATVSRLKSAGLPASGLRNHGILK